MHFEAVLTSRQSQYKRLLDEQTVYRDDDNIVPYYPGIDGLRYGRYTRARDTVLRT